MEEHEQALAALLRGDQRRAVGELRPGLVGEQPVGLGKNLAAHAHIGGHRNVGEGALAAEGREGLRRLPGQRAAELAAATAQAHRHEVVALRAGKARSGEAQEDAAAVDEAVQGLPGRGGDGADIGQHDHRHAALDEAQDGVGGRGALDGADVGEGLQRAAEIIGRRQQRLGGVGGRAGDDADRAAGPAGIDELDRAAERSPAMSRRVISLRISTGRSKRTSASVLPASKAKAASPSGRPRPSSARTRPTCAGPPCGRSTLAVKPPAVLVAAASASGWARPVSKTVTRRPETSGASWSTKALVRPVSVPSASQTTSASGWAARNLVSAGSSAARSGCAAADRWSAAARAPSPAFPAQCPPPGATSARRRRRGRRSRRRR